MRFFFDIFTIRMQIRNADIYNVLFLFLRVSLEMDDFLQIHINRGLIHIAI
jgi:hypothetical protein